MQNPALVPMLAVTTVISLVAMAVIVRSWLRSRLLPTLLYTLTISCFSAMAIDLLLDQTWMPFRHWYLDINGKVLWVSNLLLAFFIVGGFLSWYFAVMYSQYDRPPPSASLLTFVAGGALIGEVMREDWGLVIPIALEAVAFGTLIAEIARYARRVLRETPREERWCIGMYFLGFLTWIVAGPIGVVIGGIPGVPETVKDMWSIPYTVGLLMVSYSVALNPRLLFISEARALDVLMLNKNGSLVFVHRLRDYEGAIDLELMGSAMAGVMGLMKEMLASEAALRRVDHGDVKILVESGAMCTALLVATTETTTFRQSLRRVLLEFEATYREELLQGSPLITTFRPFRTRVEETFA